MFYYNYIINVTDEDYLPEYKMLLHYRLDSLVTPEVSVQNLALELLGVLNIKTLVLSSMWVLTVTDTLKVILPEC